MIVLKWIKSSSRRWKTYVANRVARIQEIIPSECWYHIPGVENPADLGSRGISVEELIQSTVWWHGPQWLISGQQPPSIQPSMEQIYDILLEEKTIKAHHADKQTPWIIAFVQRFSSFDKLMTTTAILRRYIMHIKCKRPTSSPLADITITAAERRSSLIALVRSTHMAEFSNEMLSLHHKQQLRKSSPLASLSPFISEENILRVKGRIQRSHLPDDTIHQIILPRGHLSYLIIINIHQSYCHSGLTLTLAALMRRFWIVGARDYVRLILRRCITCKKIRAETMQQQMGQLPAARVQQHRPFSHSGCDFAGPFNIKMRKGRGSTTDKCYFAIFICMATKAVHIEAVTSLSSEAFIACFRRFVARRGICNHLYSDCGTNFIGADKELSKQLQTIQQQSSDMVSTMGTTFHFNPPAAPHQGGLWEAAVKSAKYHLKRVMNSTKLSFEQFQTLLCSIESCLNSRPLVALSSDPNDMQALTPGHFLVGEPLITVPDPNLTTIPANRLDYWQHVQALSQHFWSRWSAEYLTTLQQRVKWTRKADNIKVNDLVIITEDNSHPNHWKLGRVKAVHPGSDGLVRRATVRYVIDAKSNPVRYGEALRPIQKLSLLLSSDEFN